MFECSFSFVKVFLEFLHNEFLYCYCKINGVLHGVGIG